MSDFSNLVLAADTTKMVKAVDVLDEVAAAAGRAEAAVLELAGAFKGISSKPVSDITATASAIAKVDAAAIKMAAGVSSAAAATKALDAANQATSSSINTTTSGIDKQAAAFAKLEASLDPVAAAQKKYAAAQEQIEAAVASGIVSQTQASNLLGLAATQYDRATGATKNLVKEQLESSTAWKQATKVLDDFAKKQNASASSFDRLRASIDPVYASAKRYEAAEIQMAAAVQRGTITHGESARLLAMVAAGHENVNNAAVRTTGTIGRFSHVNGLAAASTGNLAAQFNDIAVMLAAGQNPLQLALQQGTQITQIFGNTGAAGAMNILKGALLNLINPFNLMIIASIAAGAALFQYFTGIAQGQEKAKKETISLVGALQSYDQAASVTMTTTSELAKRFGDFADEVKRTSGVMLEAQTVLTMSELKKSNEGLITGLGKTSDRIKELETRVASANAEIAKAKNMGSNYDEFSRAVAYGNALIKEAADTLGMTAAQVHILDTAFDTFSASKGPVEIRDNAQALLDIFDALERSGMVLSEPMAKAVEELTKIRDQAAEGEATLNGTANAANTLAAAMTNLVNPTVLAAEAITSLKEETAGIVVDNIGKAAENAALLSGQTQQAADIAGLMAIKYAELAPALGSQISAISFVAQQEILRYQNALLTGQALDKQAEAIARQNAAIGSQHKLYAETRLESDAALKSAQERLNLLNQQNEIARLSVVYGEQSLQVTQARQAAELAVLAAMLQTLPISDSMKAAIIAAAQAGYDLANAAAIAAGNISTAAGEASRLAANLGAAARGASETASRQLAIVNSQIAAVRAGQDEVVQGKIKALDLDKAALRNAQIAAGVDASIAQTHVRKVFAAQDELIAAEATLQAAQKTRSELQKAASSGGAGGLSKGAKEAAKELKKTEKAAEDLRKELAGPMVGAIDGFANAFGDFVARGFSDFKGFVKSILDSFKQMLSQMIAMAVKNRIILSIGTSGGLFSASQVSAAGQAVAAGGGAGGIGGIIGQIAGVAGSFFSGASGFLTALTGAGGGLGAAGTYLSSALGGATASLGGFAAAVGAIAAPIAILIGVFSFFRKKTELLASGIRVTVNGMDTLVETFQTIKTTRFWGLSKKTRTSYSDAPEEVAGPIERAVAELQEGILNAAGVLGIAEEAFTNFTHTLQVDTKGMEEDEAIKAIQEAIVGLGDAFADMIPGLAAFKKNGEGSSEALNRLSTSLTAVRQMADTLGVTFNAVGLIGGHMASQLADFFGGMDAMSQATSSYYQTFYTEAERVVIGIRQTTTALEALGGTMPTTRDEYRAMVSAQDLNTEAGRKLFAALVSLAGVMDFVLPQISSFTQAIEDLANGTLTLIDNMINSTKEAEREALSAATAWENVAEGLRDFVSDLKGTTSELFTASQARTYNEMKFQTTLASSLAGDVEAAKKLTGAATDLLGSISETSGSSAQAAVAQAKILNSLEQAANSADETATDQEVLAGLLGQQITILETVADYLRSGGIVTAEYLADINAQLGNVQIAVLEAGGNSVPMLELNSGMTLLRTSITDLIVAIQLDIAARLAAAEEAAGNPPRTAEQEAAILAAQAALATAVQAKTAADALYAAETARTWGVVGRISGGGNEGDPRYGWINNSASQSTLNSLAAAAEQIRIAREQLISLGIVPQFASGGDHKGGLRIVGENGPELEATGKSRIYNAQQTREMLEGENSSELLREIRGLREEVAQFRDQSRQLDTQVVNQTRKMQLIHQDWDANGLPQERA